MLDIKFVRKNPDVVKENLVKRGETEKAAQIDELLKADENWRNILIKVNKLREQRNKATEEVSRLKKEGKDVSKAIAEVKDIPAKIKKLEAEVQASKVKVNEILLDIPNLTHESVPIGQDETDNVEIEMWGELPQFGFKPKDHIDIAEALDLVDIERAARAAGARFYYLKNELVRLNYGIINFALDFMAKKGFTIFQPPFMLKREPLAGGIAMSDFEDVIYKIENEDLYLIATSEHALLALHTGEILEGGKLPLRYSGISTCFRKEAGAHGRDTKGIFRVHQFEKVEQFIFSKPEDSWKEHELLINNAKELFQKLELPYRIVNVCTGDLGSVAAKKYDLDVWLAGQGAYREAVSCSNCTGYQAVRSNVRYRNNPGDPSEYVHTLNSTLIATERALVAILENNQQKDGSVLVPKVLVPYVGFDRIGPK